MVQFTGKNLTQRVKLARKCLAVVVFCAFVLLFAGAGLFAKYLGWMPRMEFWPAVLALDAGVLAIMAALTLAFGRVYCSVLCPLGVLQDGIYRIRITGKRGRRLRQEFSKPQNVLRYGILAVFILLTCAGVGSIACIVEPYSIFGRMVTSLFLRSVTVVFVSALTLTVLAVLVWKWGRTWCNTVCPVGSILSLISRWSIFAPSIKADKCVGCGLCSKVCRASCIDFKHHKVDSSRCIMCLDCLDICKAGALSYSSRLIPNIAVPKSPHTDSSSSAGISEKSMDRRTFISVFALAAGSLALNAGRNVMRQTYSILESGSVDTTVPPEPAGAISLNHFRHHCIGCQLCVQSCPHEVLRPAVTVPGLLQPFMAFDKGFCSPDCIECSKICPTGAIQPIKVEQKAAIQVGRAVFNPDNCIVNTQQRQCSECAKNCPAVAIFMVKQEDTGLRWPSVRPDRCLGCGRCELVCPASPQKAIKVAGFEIHNELEQAIRLKPSKYYAEK